MKAVAKKEDLLCFHCFEGLEWIRLSSYKDMNQFKHFIVPAKFIKLIDCMCRLFSDYTYICTIYSKTEEKQTNIRDLSKNYKNSYSDHKSISFV